MPGLDSSDAVMFATLLADLFPNVQVPLIFESYGTDQGGKMQMNDQVSNLEEIPVLPKHIGEFGEEKAEGMQTICKHKLPVPKFKRRLGTRFLIGVHHKKDYMSCIKTSNSNHR